MYATVVCEAVILERYKRILLLLALTYWLLPQPVLAQEKYEPTFENYQEPEPQVMERSWGNEQVAYENWRKSKKTYTKLNRPTDYTPCSCVSYARWRSGINIGSIGVARNHPVNSHTPTIGGLIVTYESVAGHLAVVVDVDSEYVYVDEANYSRCRVTYRRAIPLSSKIIKGYYK